MKAENNINEFNGYDNLSKSSKKLIKALEKENSDGKLHQGKQYFQHNLIYFDRHY